MKMSFDAQREWAKLQEAAQHLRGRLPEPPRVGIVMGSGLSAALGALEGELSIPWAEVPHFPRPTVAGHAGELTYGRLEGQRGGR